MKRFWIEFEGDAAALPAGLTIGCGVTAYDYEDALRLLQEHILKVEPMPKIRKVTENVDVSTLDPGHVLPNMLPPNFRGIWFPLNYFTY